ncbi:MAG: hypothetical protein GTN98_13350 [Woeseiaceae bacterium]|nr:hypothetical protein [Woeseiaceae bacterium]
MRNLATVIVAALLVSCAGTDEQPRQLVVAPLGSSGATTGVGMTREELEDNVRRFADRYFTRIALATREIGDESEELKRLMHEWRTVSLSAIVDIAIGANAVTNLLDMMTVTRLSRLVVESHWIPEVIGEELGAGFLQAYVDLENDIWAVADDVLTAEQQEDLRVLIDGWHAENPKQYFPWYVRLSNFSGQRAASLAAAQQTGGMLREVARAREAAEEIQAFGERVLFYLQRAPMITTNEFESAAANVLQNPEVTTIVDNMDRFVTAVDQLVQLVDQLPEERLALVDQFMDRVAMEREALLQDISEAPPEFREALQDLQPVMESLERIIAMSKEKDPDAQPFDINEYRLMVEQAAVTAAELRLLNQSITEVLANSQNLNPLVDALVAAERQIVGRFMLQMAGLIVVFFIILLGYRIVAARIVPR